jgi:hypothetical protein
LADNLSSLKEIGRNHYVLGGYSASNISGDKTEQSRGDYDYWLVELKYIPANPAVLTLPNITNIKLFEKKQFTVSPNPAKDIVYLQTSHSGTFCLFNQSGTIILTKTITGKGNINVANLPAGLYYLKNISSGEVQKVMVTR